MGTQPSKPYLTCIILQCSKLLIIKIILIDMVIEMRNNWLTRVWVLCFHLSRTRKIWVIRNCLPVFRTARCSSSIYSNDAPEQSQPYNWLPPYRNGSRHLFIICRLTPYLVELSLWCPFHFFFQWSHGCFQPNNTAPICQLELPRVLRLGNIGSTIFLRAVHQLFIMLSLARYIFD
jgi:hypothetical protein